MSVSVSGVAPRELAGWAHQRLLALSDPLFGEGQRRFFQHEVDTYGVRTKELHRFAGEVYRVVKPWPAPQRNRAMDELWKLGKLEGGAVACYVYRRFARQCGTREFQLFEEWIDRYVRNWAHTDGVASWLLAAAIENEPPLMKRLASWTTSPNRWKRRAAAVALLQEAKKGRNTAFLLGIADRLLDDRDDMVEKGVGWLLKEAYPAKPRETVEFLRVRRARASRLTLRYAAEKMTARDREIVLHVERSAGVNSH